MDFAELKQKVLEKTPFLQRTLEHKGDSPLLNYFEENLRFSNQGSLARQNELLGVVHRKIDKLLSREIADQAILQLRDYYYTSTADHHGPITHPFFVNSHLTQSYANQKHNLTNIFVFACSGVSLNNSSFPRGVFFHDRHLEKKRSHFISLKHRHSPVFGFPAYTEEDVEKNEDLRVQKLIQEVYKEKEVSNKTYYTEQISRTNFTLWKKIPGQEKINLIYLSQEEIVNELILKYHLDTHTIITELLTNESVIKQFEKYFEGIRGALSQKEGKGTTLFWALHEGERKKLSLKNNTLETEDGLYSVALNIDSIKAEIKTKHVMPSMALSFIVLSFYYGLTCGGGFLQVNYLSEMKKAYKKLLGHIDKTNEINTSEKITTDYFCGEFAFAMMSNEKRIAKASSIDLILYGNKGTGIQLQELTGVCTLGEAIDQMMPTFYQIIYGRDSAVPPPPFRHQPILYV